MVKPFRLRSSSSEAEGIWYCTPARPAATGLTFEATRVARAHSVGRDTTNPPDEED
jgi:hypothetical protein